MKKYKSGKLFVGLFFSCLICFCQLLYAWENKFTHPAITKKSVNSNNAIIDDYLKTQLGLSGGLSTQLYWNFPTDIKNRMTENKKVDPNKTKTVLDWLKAGSAIEDEDGRSIPWRPRHHFYDPTRNAGLDNNTAHPDWDAPGTSSWLPLGQSALDWAVDGSASYQPYTNNDKWNDARELFYNALTATDTNDREAYLAESMVKLGCVLHLLEDMGVPAHTRNDFLFGHFRSIFSYGNDLEKDVESRIEANGGNSLWNGSGGVTFDKLANYFDTDTRDAEQYLGSGILPPETWGLAEATNYQFWSLSTIVSYLPKYYFSHPHLVYMGTDIEEGATNKKIYFNGVNYGLSHMARKSYTQYYTVTYGLYPALLTEEQQKIDSTITTNDEKVFDDYADITIPRTINYATGLANYFFRGKLNSTAYCIECNAIELTITNKSINSNIQQTLKGGTFEIYWDNSNGVRNKINDIVVDGDWTSSSTLAYNDSIMASFIKPDNGTPYKYIIVYKGNICENSNDIDSDDEAAIAATTTTAPNNDCCPLVGFDDCDGSYGCGWPDGKYPELLIARTKGIRCSSDDSIIEELEDKCWELEPSRDPGYGCNLMYWAGGHELTAQVEYYLPANVEIGDQFYLTVSNGSSSHTITFTATQANANHVASGLVNAWNNSTNFLCTPVTAYSSQNHVYLEADTAGIPFNVAPSTTNGGTNDIQTLTRTIVAENFGVYYPTQWGGNYWGIEIHAGSHPYNTDAPITIRLVNGEGNGHVFTWRGNNCTSDEVYPCPSNSYSNCGNGTCYPGDINGYGGSITFIDATGVNLPADWANATAYIINDVRMGAYGKAYRCKANHTSSISSYPPIGSDWEQHWEPAYCDSE